MAVQHEVEQQQEAAECLTVQAVELLGVSEAYADCLQLTSSERRRLHAACTARGLESPLQQQPQLDAEDGYAPCCSSSEGLSGACLVPGIRLGQAPVYLRFRLPAAYPYAAKGQLSVETACTSSEYEQLSACVNAVAERELATGSCCLLAALQETKECVERLATAAAAAAAANAAGLGAGPGPGSAEDPLIISRVLIWFHHIKSVRKRSIIMAEARSLGLGGGSKPGFPGVIVAEGEACQVQEFTKRIRALTWQAMQVRHCQSEALQPQPPDAPPMPRPQRLDAARKLERSFVELPESGLSEMGSACRRAGLEALFLSALKV